MHLQPAIADDKLSEDGFTPLPPKEAKAVLDAVRKDWHSRSGESVTEMLARLKVSIGFKPQKWYADTRSYDGKKVVSLTWTRKPGETEADRAGIVWKLDNGVPVLEENDRLFGLGSAAFAINEIEQDVDNEVRTANTLFLHDPKNLNFVQTPNGRLGDLLATAGCHIGEPLYVWPVAAGFIDKGNGFVRFQATVDCPLSAVSNVYSQQGALIAMKLVDGAKDWLPTSFLAERLWRGKPGHWSDVDLPIEDQVIEVAMNAANMPRRYGFEWVDVVRVIELRNSGKSLPDAAGDMHAFETDGLLLKIQTNTNGLVRPAAIETFLRHAGILATTMSDDGIVRSIPLFFIPR